MYILRTRRDKEDAGIEEESITRGRQRDKGTMYHKNTHTHTHTQQLSSTQADQRTYQWVIHTSTEPLGYYLPKHEERMAPSASAELVRSLHTISQAGRASLFEAQSSNIYKKKIIELVPRINSSWNSGQTEPLSLKLKGNIRSIFTLVERHRSLRVLKGT